MDIVSVRVRAVHSVCSRGVGIGVVVKTLCKRLVAWWVYSVSAMNEKVSSRVRARAHVGFVCCGGCAGVCP